MVLDDICVLIADCPHSTAPNEGTGYPLIRTPNIGKARFLLDGVHRVSEQIYEQRNKRATPQDNDIIFAREAPAGNAAIIKNGDKFCLGQRTVLIRPDPQKVNPDYLVYYLLAPEQQHKLLSTAHGATVSHVNIPDIHNMNVDNLPSLEIQKQIADMLIAYDNLIENNQKQIKLLEEAAQRLYKEWFIDLRFPGYETTPIHDGVPEGWEGCTLSGIATVNAYSLPKNYAFDYLDYIDLSAVNVGRIDGSTRYSVADAPGRAKRIAHDGDVIWGMVRPNLKSYALVFHPSDTDVFSTGFAILSAEKVPFTYLYCAVTQPSFVSYLVNCTNGAAYPAVRPEHFEKAIIIKPTDVILRRFHETVDPLFRKTETLRNQNRRLAEARDRLLPKLMNGEIEV